MNILGLNPSHHGSVCLLQDGKLKYFVQEERITRKKYDFYPFKSFIYFLENYKIDYITYSTPSIEYLSSGEDPTPYWLILASKYHPKVKAIDYSDKHHSIHGAHSFYNSGFDKALVIVVDGVGSSHKNYHKRETESIFKFSYPDNCECLYQNITNFKTQVNLSRAYEAITMHLGWSRDEAGKTMGLSSYGKFNPLIPKFIKNNTSTPIFQIDFTHPNQTLLDFPLSKNPKEWHYNPSKITNLEIDIAYKIQIETQQLVGDYIEKYTKKTGLNQVCCAGGYFLNVITNYYLVKRFPNIKFYFEPIANDAGTAIGAARLLWYNKTQSKKIMPINNLYLGKNNTKESLLNKIKKYVSN